MKSIRKLLAEDAKRTYLNGETAYYGDVTRYYTSFFLVKMIARIVKKPEGSQTIFNSDSELKSAVSKIPFGQIGAKYDNISVPANTQIAEIIMPVSFNEETELKDSIVDLYNAWYKFDDMKFITKEGQSLSFSEAKELIKPYREVNSQIRDSWISKAAALREFGASAEELLAEKISQYSDYMALCDYTLVIEFTITHIVNNPELKSTVVNEGYSQEQYNALAYKEGRYRKSATFKAPLVTVPLQSVEQYTTLVDSFNNIISRSDGERPFKGKSFDRVLSDGMIYNGKVLDLSRYEQIDRETTMARSHRHS